MAEIHSSYELESDTAPSAPGELAYDVDLTVPAVTAAQPLQSRQRRRRAIIAGLVLAFSCGATAAIAAESLIRATRERTEVSVLVLTTWESSALRVVESPRSHGGPDGVQLSTVVQVVNMGPRPITLGAISADADGYELAVPDGHRRLLPRGHLEVLLDVSVDCVVLDRTPSEISLGVHVRTDDGTERTMSVPLDTEGLLAKTLPHCPRT